MDSDSNTSMFDSFNDLSGAICVTAENMEALLKKLQAIHVPHTRKSPPVQEKNGVSIWIQGKIPTSQLVPKTKLRKIEGAK